MKILLANKFYYRCGGDCIYMLNLEKLLKAHESGYALEEILSKEYEQIDRVSSSMFQY